MNFTIKTDDKPHLDHLLRTDKKKGIEVIGTFVELMEEAVANGWHELPQLFSEKLTFRDLVKGILHGSLDLPDIAPDTYDALKEEVHPLSKLSPRRNFLDGGMRLIEWRNYFRMPPDAEINQETIAQIFRKMLRYTKYVDIQKLAEAHINRQIKTYEGLGERNIQTLPFIPALRYQQAHFGDLHVGKYFDEVGFFNCGEWMGGDSKDCPACKRPDIHIVGQYRVCLACNAGFKEVIL